MSSVFISYRRSASKHLARLLFEKLRSQGYDVFLDINTIDSGAFDRIILNQIAARSHFVLILSQGSLERCVNEDDWLRREMVEAFRLKRNIVPIYDEGFDIRDEQQYLPESIRIELPRLNAPPYSSYYFDAFMDTLCTRFLKPPEYEVVIIPTPPADRSEVARRIGASASGGKNNERKMSGSEIYEKFKDGTLSMYVMGRAGGFYGKFMRDDFKSEAWRMQSYETSSVTNLPNHNWFYIKDFVTKIDALATIGTSGQNIVPDNFGGRRGYSSSGKNNERKMTGLSIYEEFKDGTLTMYVMGRAGGFYGKLMIDDLKTDAWRTQSYETSSMADLPNHNWFYIKDFVAKIDALTSML